MIGRGGRGRSSALSKEDSGEYSRLEYEYVLVCNDISLSVLLCSAAAVP